jgi:hypothetical protein
MLSAPDNKHPQALDIKFFTSTERAEIQGVIPLALPTTERTLGINVQCSAVRYSYVEERGYALSTV